MSSSSGWVVFCSVLSLAASGCSKAKLDPCSLLGVGEAQLFDSTVSISIGSRRSVVGAVPRGSP